MPGVIAALVQCDLPVRSAPIYAQGLGLIEGDVLEIPERFTSLLWGELLIGLLLGVAEAPAVMEIRRRASAAIDAILRPNAAPLKRRRR